MTHASSLAPAVSYTSTWTPSSPRWMRFLTLEDETGLAEVVIFADVYERDGARLAKSGTQRIRGVVHDQMGAVTLHAEQIV